MNQTNLSKWLKGIAIVIGVLGTLLLCVVAPAVLQETILAEPELSRWFWPWLIFLFILAIPCYLGLIVFYQIATRIGFDNSFCLKNATGLAYISRLAILDVILCFIGNVIFLFCNISHPSIFLMFLCIEVIGIIIAIICAALGHLVLKASKLKEENDLTI